MQEKPIILSVDHIKKAIGDPNFFNSMPEFSVIKKKMDAMHVDFNITLFQYRYHGADFGRVLVGIEVPPEKAKAFSEFLDRVEGMGYPYIDETDNDAYRLFLGWHNSK